MTEPAAETTDPLLAFILSCLTPLLATSSLADAANAARQAIAAYNATAADQLLTIAQVVGFAIAALDNLRLSASLTHEIALVDDARDVYRFLGREVPSHVIRINATQAPR